MEVRLENRFIDANRMCSHVAAKIDIAPLVTTSSESMPALQKNSKKRSFASQNNEKPKRPRVDLARTHIKPVRKRSRPVTLSVRESEGDSDEDQDQNTSQAEDDTMLEEEETTVGDFVQKGLSSTVPDGYGTTKYTNASLQLPEKRTRHNALSKNNAKLSSPILFSLRMQKASGPSLVRKTSHLANGSDMSVIS